jgi:hypothetical protein
MANTLNVYLQKFSPGLFSNFAAGGSKHLA